MVVESRQLRKPLVVGVDGSKDGLRAVEYAAGEAARLGCGVRLVHALHVDAPVAPMLPLFSSEGLEEVAGRVGREAAVLVERLSGGTVPTSSQRTRSPPKTGPSVHERLNRVRPSSPITGSTQVMHTPIPQAIDSSTAT